MAIITIVSNIEATAEVIFRTVADAELFAQAVDGVTKVESMTEISQGIGTRYRQSRMMNGKETTMEFEVTEYIENERIRFINETQGTVWDSLFTIVDSGCSSTLTMQMETRSDSLILKIFIPLLCLLIRKSVRKDIEALKTFCEKQQATACGEKTQL